MSSRNRIVGDYLIAEKIGKGSFADVYNCKHEPTGKKYALKIVNREHLMQLGEPRLITGLESEIKFMKDLDHENIVRLNEFFSTDKNFYLVLELCLGGDLNKYIRKKKKLDEKIAMGFLLQIANGLAFLQERKIMHRDLKPANVLLSENSDGAMLKLADFGFAKHLGAVTLAQTRCGTPLYMAPEILEGREYDGKADIWSVGCIYYEMLVGTCPFKGSNEVDLLNNINKKNLVIPSELEISSLSLDVLSKLLERVPDKRASVAQLMVLKSQLPRLSSSAASHGIPEEPPSRPRSASRHTALEEVDDTANRHNPSSASLQAHSPVAGSPVLASQQTTRTPQMAFGSLNPTSATAATTLSMSPTGITFRPQNPNVSPSSMNPTAFYDSTISQPIHSSQKNHGIGKGGLSADPSSSGKRHSTDSTFSHSLANNNNNSNNNNTSAAAAIIGNIGKAFNFMMYSPSHSHRGPGNNTGVNIASVNPRGHIPSSGKYSPSYDRRSISLDRANPPPFTGGPQPITGRTRQNSSVIPSYHQQPTSFYPEDPSSSGSGRQYYSSHSHGGEAFDAFGTPLHSIPPPNAIPSNRRETLQASAPDAEDDFVFIPSSASGSSSHIGEGGSNNSSQTLHQEHKVSDTQEHHPGDLPSLNRQVQSSQLFQIDELSPPSTSLFLSNVTKRCHITCKIVQEITTLGDEYIQKVMNAEFAEKNSISPKQPTAIVARGGGYIQRRSISGSILQTPAAMVDNYLIAISLYFHALNILKNLMASITEGTTGANGPRTSTEEVVTKIREGLFSLCKQLIRRTEQCYSNMKLIYSLDRGSAMPLEGKEFPLPITEVVMLDAAVKKEADGGFEELVGNLPLACKMYLSAQELVNAVLMTVSEQEEKRRLQTQADRINGKLSACMGRADHLGFDLGSGNNRPSYSSFLS